MNPVLAEVFRKNIVESCHRGSAIVVDTQGKTVFSLGEVDHDIYPRSSLKLMQAIPLVESGAADKYQLSDKEISLACASHNAETYHVDTVTQWLDRLELNSDDLECGPDLPLLDSAAHQLIADHQPPTRAHQNCSGKHTGMLTMARYLDETTKGYSEYEHAVQQTWMQTLSELIDIDVSELEWERDGCGMPAICMPMDKLALGFARFADLDNIEPGRAAAMKRILNAITKHPEMIAGTERCCSAVIAATNGKVIVKTGAEAVYGGVIPYLGLGFALKVDDGARRGSEVALGALLKKLNAITEKEYEELQPWFEPEVKNTQKKVTGKVAASKVWGS